MTKRLVSATALVLVSCVAAFGQERPIIDLKDLPSRQRVTAVTYCRGGYDVSLGGGSARKFKEYDLAFKIDSSANGPDPTRPALVATGRVGDRAFVVFADLEELRSALKAGTFVRRRVVPPLDAERDADEARAADADDDRPALAGEAQRAPASLEARHHRRHSMRTAEPPQASHGSSGCKDLPEIRCAPSGLGERFSAEHRGTVLALRVAGLV